MLQHGACLIHALLAAGRLDHHIRAPPAGQFEHRLHRILAAGIDHHIASQSLGEIQLPVRQIDRHHPVCALALCRLGDDLAGEAHTIDHHDVAELGAAGQS